MLSLTLAGCAGQSGPFAPFHGMTAKPPPAAPGLKAPYPNLASVPAKPPSISAADQRQIRAQLEAANQAARAQLQPAPPAAPATPAPLRQAPPQLVGFATGSAIIPRRQLIVLQNLARGRGDASAALAAGFAPAATTAGLNLALHRALAIANEMIRAGLPLADIRIAALASGHGGFAELLYDIPPRPQPATVKIEPKSLRKDHQ